MNYDRVTVYLRAPLFTLPGEAAHVPAQAVILEGAIVDDKGGPVLRTSRFLDEKGRLLATQASILVVPWSKIDHIRVEEAVVTGA